MAAEVLAFIRFLVVSNIQTINFCKILSVTVSQGSQLVVTLLLLQTQVVVRVLVQLQVVLQSLDLHVSVRDCNSLSINL